MKNKTLKTTFHRGFTLIELMIVIVILGILMGTILPRITGAQSRARDTGRLADLNSISQALELYYDDFGAYPEVTTAGTPECLDSTLTKYSVFKTYFKGEDIPTPPTSGENVIFEGYRTCEGAYMYLPLVNKGVANNGYILLTNMEIAQKANYSNSANALSIIATTSVKDVRDWYDANVDNVTPEDMVVAEAASDEDDTIYILVQ